MPEAAFRSDNSPVSWLSSAQLWALAFVSLQLGSQRLLRPGLAAWLALAMALPGPVLRFVMWAMRVLDRVNLMPGVLIHGDPMYTSVFVANLGSVGLDRTSHHLYEYGTAAMFAAMGTPRKQTVFDRAGNQVVRDILEVRWSLDERVNDGLYCARTLAQLKKVFEDPAEHMRAAAGVPTPIAQLNPA